MKLLKSIALAAFPLLLTSLCSAQTWKGKLYYSYAGSDIKEYNLASKTDKALFKEAREAFVAANGEIYYLDQNYRKRNALIRKSNTTYTQFRDVLDMTGDNPLYKKRLEDYSLIRGTGNSGVMSEMHHPRVSPDGKYLAVTIYGYNQQVFDKNCVGVFDLATGNLVAKFENKYYGSWTPDGRLLMSGADKSESVNGNVTKAVTPGIFITDKNLSTVSRIDPQLDDPSPYHAVASPDGKQVAFVLNDHIWIMNMDGSGARQLTAVDNDNIETFPAWSPDGKWIACWTYKTFERSYYTAIAVVPSNSAKPVVLSNAAPVWPKDAKGYRISGGSMQLSWKGDGVMAAPAGKTILPPAPPKTPKAPAPPKPAITIGNKVRFPADDGSTHTGVIKEIKDGKYKVHYDGYDFDAWLTKEQFEVVK